MIFVISSYDHDRLEAARYELYMLFREKHLRNASFLIFANAEDHPNATSVAEIMEYLELPKNRIWYVQGSSGIYGDGLYEGLDWLNTKLGGWWGGMSREDLVPEGSPVSAKFAAVPNIASSNSKVSSSESRSDEQSQIS